MTMLESTISMIKVMPEADLAEVPNFARKLLWRRDEGCPFPLKSRDDIYKELEISRKQIADGEYREAREFIAEVRKEYGIRAFAPNTKIENR